MTKGNVLQGVGLATGGGGGDPNTLAPAHTAKNEHRKIKNAPLARPGGPCGSQHGLFQQPRGPLLPVIARAVAPSTICSRHPVFLEQFLLSV